MQQNAKTRLLAATVLTASLSAVAGAQSIKSFISLPYPAQGVAVDQVSNKIYVVEPNNGLNPFDDLIVIDGNTDTQIADVQIPTGSLYVTVDTLAHRAFVAGCNTQVIPSPCSVTAIDGKTNTILKNGIITSTPGFGITGIAANSVTGFVYVANGSDNEINVFNGRTLTAAGLVYLSGSPFGVAVNQLTSRVYAPLGSNQTAVVDGIKEKVLSYANYGENTVGVAVNSVNGRVLVADAPFLDPSTTGVLDSKGNTLASVTVDDGPLGVDVDPITNLAFVASTYLDTVDVISSKTNTLTSTVSGVPATYVAVNYVTQKVYVTGRTGVTVLSEK
jgi:DNA-binding beta-propeller fold protein YncE